MEPIGAKNFDEEWESSFSGIFSNVEADHFMAQEYGANNECGNTFIYNGITSSKFLPIDDTNVNISEIEGANLYNLVNSFHTNFQHFSEENSNISGSNSSFFLTPNYKNNHHLSESSQMQVRIHEYINISSDEGFVPKFPHVVMEDSLFMKTDRASENAGNGYNQSSNVADLGEELKLKRKIDMQDLEASGDEKQNEFNESPKKKSRLPRDAQKAKRNALSRKNKQKISMNGTEDENNGTIDTQNHPSSCSSENDRSINIASQDSKGEVNAALNSSGKTRASRGAATDPQSLYARRRRERINERLRILQNLVPNGTKVDISTMLEEAVHYVKFLQQQIKLLSSDEMWMFAPIAYNGMDMGLYNKISI